MAWASLMLVLGVALLLAWLLWTTRGRDVVLGRIAAAMPTGSLRWQRAEGVIAGPLTLHDVRFRHAGVDFSATRVTLDPALSGLLRGRLQLDTLTLEAGILDLPIDRTPQPPPRWPDVLPRLDVPFTTQVRALDLRGLRISREGAPLLAITRAHGALTLAPGRVEIAGLDVASDRGVLHMDARMDARRAWATRLRASWQAPADAQGPPAQLRLVAGGDLDRFVLALGGNAPAPLALRLTLRNGRQVPDWTLQATSANLDPAALAALFGSSPRPTQGAPWSFALDAAGHGGRARLQGRLAQGGATWVIAPSRLAFADGVIDADPLALDLLGGHLRLDGHIDLRPQAPTVDARATVDGLRWRADPNAEPVQASGKLALHGSLDDWLAAGSVRLLRGAEHARLTFSARGDLQQSTLEKIDITTPAGTLRGSGTLRWAPTLAWRADAQLDRFDPGYLAPGFEGAVSARLRGSGGIGSDARWSLQATIDGLGGKLRGRALGGHASVDWKADRGMLDADLQVGGSRVQAKGRIGAANDLQLRLDPLQLSDVLPSARGRVEGQLSIRGTLPVPAVEGRLDAHALAWQGFGARHLRLEGRLTQAGGDGTLQILGEGLTGVAGVDRMTAQLRGSPTQPQLRAQVAGPAGSLELALDAQRRGPAWSGRIASLQFAPPQGQAWTLAAPAAFSADARGTLRLASTCLQADTASICAQIDWPHRASLQARALPLAWIDPWIAQSDLQPQAWGTVNLDAQGAADARGRWSGQARVDSDAGGIRLASRSGPSLLGYTGLSAHARLAGDRVHAQASALLAAGGSLQAQLTSGLSSTAPWQGSLGVDLRDITWLELFSTDIAAPTGEAQARLTLGGSPAQPTFSGHLKLSDLRTELPALGVSLRDGQIGVDADATGAATISGSLRAGEGTLAVGGQWHWNQSGAPVTLTLKGQNLRVADTPELQADASPDLQLGFAAGTLNLRGTVEVPSAKLDLERLDESVSPSPDVVVLDPVEKTRSTPLKLDVDLRLALGKQVKLKGFGLDGTLGGQLRVRKPPGGGMHASGALEVGGYYAAYGQQLQIERARLQYNGSGFDDPALDVLAQRQFDDGTTVGVRVRGSARRPQTQIVSTPAMDPTQALAYLVIGRPLQSADPDETRRIGAASAALAVGSNLIAQTIGARLGLDAAGVNDSRALGGEAFTVGKYLSPRLFVSYGVALAGTGEVLTLKYLLRKGFDIRIESAKENRASVNWRIER